LLNHLMGEARFSTGAVREKDAKGRHTTTQRQLVHLAGGAMVVDTPGMRELGNVSADAGVAGTFTEIAALAAQCRFNDCTHVHEQDCAVLAAVQAGRLPAQRHENYLKMVRERQHYERSHAQRRQLDKQFGKYCKAVMKHKKDRR
ncbi:MAG: GTPase RsgA, partial [Desulfatitalea sp.]|nr:GTPase RsgA [Desulfatitalea sp.]